MIYLDCYYTDYSYDFQKPVLGNTETIEEDFTVARLYVSKLKSEVKSLHGHNQTLEAGMSENTSQLESLREQISKVRGVILMTRLSKIWSIMSCLLMFMLAIRGDNFHDG